MKATVELPGRRAELIEELKDLSDFEMQKQKWVDPKFKHSFSDEMDFPIDAILEECDFHKESSKNLVGIRLRSEEEWEAVHAVAKALMRIINEIGMDQPDSAYINSPLWQDVVEKAKISYEILMEDDSMEDLLKQAEEKRVS